MSIIGHGVAQGGTYNNNKVGVAAAVATLDLLQRQLILETIAHRGQRLMDGLEALFSKAGVPVCIQGYPAMFSFAIGVEKPSDQRAWAASDAQAYLKLIEAAIARGVMPDHDAREPWFLCYSHSEADIDETLNVMEEAVKEIFG